VPKRQLGMLGDVEMNRQGPMRDLYRDYGEKSSEGAFFSHEHYTLDFSQWCAQRLERVTRYTSSLVSCPATAAFVLAVGTSS
jgi:hypothetical protein